MTQDVGPEGFLVWEVMERGMALCNMIHFLSWLYQVVPLFGNNGLEPAKHTLQEARKKYPIEEYADPAWLHHNIDCVGNHPTLFWLSTSDLALKGVCMFGFLCSSLLFLYPSAYMLWWPCFVCALSISVVSGSFALQTEAMMVEISFLMAIASPFRLQSWESPYIPYFPLLLFNWYIFRLMLAAGFVKWYGSPVWRNLTAMNVHYWTQPIPNPMAWFMHVKVPSFFHKFSVAMSLFIELPLPFIGLLPWWPTRLFTFLNYAGLMAMINLTGNYGHLGFVTSMIGVSLLYDWMVPGLLFSWLPSATSASPFFFFSLPCPDWFSFVLSLLLIGVSVVHFLSTLPCLFSSWDAHYKLPIWLTKMFRQYVQPLQIANPYGMFASMQDYRWELMLEGSNDGSHWERYEFPWKLCDPSKPLPIVLPLGYWPRLDWHMWLLGVKTKMQYDTVMQIGDSNWLRPPPWYRNLLDRVMEGDKEVLRLIAKNPFPNKPPKYLRTVVCDYKFAPASSPNWCIEREIVVPGAFCKGPKGWAPPTISIEKTASEEPVRQFRTQLFT